MPRAISLLILLISFHLSLQQTYDFNTAFEMLRASSAAYCQTEQLESMQCGDICDDLDGYGYQFVTQSTYNISAYQSVSYSMFVNTEDNVFITAFRGTHGLDQLIHEFIESKAVTYSLNNVSNAVVAEYFLVNYQDYLRDNFLANIKSAAQQYSSFDFYIVGHSLGAALANLGVLDVSFLNIIPKSQLHMYTYGAPRTGDGNLAQAVVNSVNDLYRVTHYKDPVPHIPPCIDILGECREWSDHISENDFPIFNAWHTWPEIFYNTENGTTYIECDQAENTTCSDQFSLLETQIQDHLNYLGVSTKCLNNGPIVSDSSDSDDSSDFYPITGNEEEFFLH